MGAACSKLGGRKLGGYGARRNPSAMNVDVEISGYGCPNSFTSPTLLFLERSLASPASFVGLAQHKPSSSDRGLVSQTNILGYGCRNSLLANTHFIKYMPSTCQAPIDGCFYRNSLLTTEMLLPTAISSFFDRGLSSQTGTKVQDRDAEAAESDFDDLGDVEAAASDFDDLLGESSSEDTEQERNPVDGLSSEDDMDLEEEDEDSKSELDDGIDNPLDSAATAMKYTKQDAAVMRDRHVLLGRIRKSKVDSVKAVLTRWKQNGGATSREMIVGILVYLRRTKKYRMGLEVCEWLMKEKPFNITEVDYAYQLEHIAKVHGVIKAEQFFALIPKKFKSQMVYSTLLVAYVNHNSVKKADRLAEEIEKLDLEMTTSMYNQLLLVHKRVRPMGRVAELVKKMDEKNIRANVITYNILLDLKARRGDVDGMDMIMSLMEENKVNPDKGTYCAFAKGYLAAGLKEKALQALHKAETADWKSPSNHSYYHSMLQLYGDLGNLAELERIWKIISDSTKRDLDDYIRMIEALGRMGKVERAEEIFHEMWQSKGIGRIRQVNALLSVYAKQGMAVKAEELVKKLSEEALSPSYITYHYLVQLYVKLGSQEKVVEVLEHIQQNLDKSQSLKNRPLYSTLELILKMFADKGDVANAEKTFLSLKKVGYVPSFNLYSCLLNAYGKAGVAPYGYLDRMQFHGNTPNAHVRNMVRLLQGT